MALTILERRNRGIGAGGRACLRRLEKSERHMTLSFAPKMHVASATLAKLPVRCRRGAFGRLCLDCRPQGRRHSSQDLLCNRLMQRLLPNRPEMRGLAIMRQVSPVCRLQSDSTKRDLCVSLSGLGMADKWRVASC